MSSKHKMLRETPMKANVLKKIEVRFRKLQTSSFDDFLVNCSIEAKKLEIRKNIIDGDVYIIRNVLSKEEGHYILKQITKDRMGQSKDFRILEGIKNIYYESNHLKRTKSEYSSVDKSWYFFPWNKDELDISKFLQPIFDNVILLNNRKPNIILNNTPIDGIVQRFHLINYPPGSGQISLHRDPVNICQINSGIYLSQFGIDYSEGGFYVLNDNDDIVYLDNHVNFCDMILFFPGLPHGVSPIKSIDSKNDRDGRYFLNMNLIQSHHIDNRIPSIGIET